MQTQPIDRDLQARFRFFQEHAGYIVGERARCALDLARAEREAERRGWVVSWEPDPDADWSWLDQPGFEREREKEHVVESCVVYGVCDCCGQHKILASLGGIFDADDDYRRVVEAELFLIALGRER